MWFFRDKLLLLSEYSKGVKSMALLEIVLNVLLNIWKSNFILLIKPCFYFVSDIF